MDRRHSRNIKVFVLIFNGTGSDGVDGGEMQEHTEARSAAGVEVVSG